METIVKQMRDGKWAVCKEIKVNNNCSVIMPIDNERYISESDAWLRRKSEPEVEEKPMAVLNKNNLPPREKFRVTKLDKGVFVVELMNKVGKWVEVKTCTSKTRAEEYIINHSK